MIKLHKNTSDMFFDEQLIEDIKLGNNNSVAVASMLKNIPSCHLVSSSDGTTLLHFAAKYGNLWLTKYLLDLGTDVDVQSHRKDTPLIAAVEANQNAIVYTLLKANANIFIRDVDNRCALGKALSSQFNNCYIEKALLEKVTIDSLDKNSEYVKSIEFQQDCGLYHFILLKNTEITRYLLKNGSPINAQKYKTALHKAVDYLDIDNIKLLIKYNADVNAKDCHGRTPLATISNVKSPYKLLQIVNILLAAGATLIDYDAGVIIVKYLLIHGTREIIRVLLQHELELQYFDNKGMCALHLIASNKHPDVLDELRDFDFEVDIHCEDGCTMLHYAARIGNVSSIEFLVEQDSDVESRNLKYHTPLREAIDSFEGGNKTAKSCVKVLFEYADPETILKEATRLFASSSRENCINIIKLFIGHFAMLQESGRSVSELILKKIYLNFNYKDIFTMNKRHLEEMKKINIDDSTTLFECLLMSDREITRYAGNSKLVLILPSITKDNSIDSYCSRKVRERLLKLIKLNETRGKVASLLNEIVKYLYNISVENICEKIASYLEYKDVRKIL